jgi:DNA-binding beta-propeller fold protein YncE
MHSCKTVLVGIIFALIVGLAQAATVVYVTSFDNDSVLKFDADTGASLGTFVPSGSGGLNGPTGLTFGPDGHLYVSSFVFNFSVLKYDGETGQFLGEFVTSGSGGLLTPMDLGFGPDGNLYVVSTYAGGVFRYNGTTGAFIDQFTTDPSGAEAIRWRGNSMFISGHNDDEVLRFRARNGAPMGPMNEGGFLDWATGFDFGPDGNIYIASFFDDTVVKFNRRTGQSMGTFASNCDGPEMIEFGPDGDLYVASNLGDSIDRFDGRTGRLKLSIFGGGLVGPMDIAFRDH